MSFISKLAMLGASGVTTAGTPSVVTSSYFSSSSSTSHTIPLPSEVNTGDLLLVLFALDGSSTRVNSTSGWTISNKNAISGASAAFGYMYRTADGSEGSTLAVPLNSSDDAAFVCLSIAGATGDVEDAVTNVGYASSGNPAAVSPTWGTALTLFLVSFHFSEGQGRLSTNPSGYTSVAASENTNSGSSYCDVSVVSKTINTGTEDPGTGSYNSHRFCGVITLAIRLQ